MVACIDESVESESSDPVAATWARLLHVPLVLLTVENPHLRHLPLQAHTIADAVDGERVMHLASTTRLDWPDLDVRCHVARYPWNVADALALYLDKHPSQLFVAASHIRTGVSRLLHPTTTGHITRALAAPLLVIPIPADPIDPPNDASPTPLDRPFAEVIVPVGDHRPVIDACIATANNLAVLASATIVLLTCDQNPDRVRQNDQARTQLIGMLDPTEARWRVADSGDVVEEATTHGESIICLATHAPGRIMDTLLPTVTGQLVR